MRNNRHKLTHNATEGVSDMVDRWEQERQARRDDEERAQRAGLGVDPAFLAARERVQKVVWVGEES